MLRKQNGITLVALVITIIVLLILAGVTIAMVVGDNGILSRARQSKFEQEAAEALENLQTAASALTAELVADGKAGPTEQDMYKAFITDAKLKNDGDDYTFPDTILDDNTGTTTLSNTTYTVTYQGNLDGSKKNSSATSLQKYDLKINGTMVTVEKASDCGDGGY